MNKRLHWTQTEEGKKRLRERARTKAIKNIAAREAIKKGEEITQKIHVLEKTSISDAITMIEREISKNQRLLEDLQELAKRIVEASND